MTSSTVLFERSISTSPFFWVSDYLFDQIVVRAFPLSYSTWTLWVVIPVTRVISFLRKLVGVEIVNPFESLGYSDSKFIVMYQMIELATHTHHCQSAKRLPSPQSERWKTLKRFSSSPVYDKSGSKSHRGHGKGSQSPHLGPLLSYTVFQEPVHQTVISLDWSNCLLTDLTAWFPVHESRKRLHPK